MARTKVNKSQAVRDYFEIHPNAKAKEVIVALKRQGIAVSPNYISVVKSKRLAKTEAVTANGQAQPGLEVAVQLARACQWDFGTARHFLGLVEQVHESLK